MLTPRPLDDRPSPLPPAFIREPEVPRELWLEATAAPSPVDVQPVTSRIAFDVSLAGDPEVLEVLSC